jgi:general secretion pathway protein I
VHGFSLLEAIVALAILAALGLVLFDWIRQSLDSASRIRAEHLRVQALINAQSLVASINPGAEPEGERSVAGLTVRWTSRMIAGPQALFGEVLRPDEAPEGWQIALYELTVQGTYPAGEGDPAGRLPLSFQAVRAGAMPAPVARPVSR